MALQREGLLPGFEELSKARTSRQKHEKQDLKRLLPSLEDSSDKSRPTRTKEDVEAIGRPWLDDALASITKDEDISSSQIDLPLNSLRNESLSLGDLAALVDFSVSFPELYSHDSDPPPYQAQAQSQPESQFQPQLQPQSQSSGVNNVATTNNIGESENQGSLCVELSAETPSRNTYPKRDESASQKPDQGYRGSETASRQIQYKVDKGKNEDDSGCESNCDCDDAKSLAILLRATERLGSKRKSEKERITQNSAAGKTSSATSSTVANVVVPTTTTFTSATTTATAESGESNLTPHSLNQGVTDTPLFIRNVVEYHHDEPESAKKMNIKAPRGTSQLSSVTQAELRPTGHLNVGPIPLKLVAECMPPGIPKSVTPQPLNPSVSRPRSNLNGHIDLLQPPSTNTGLSAASFPRPRALLSPIPIQSRRARSMTPDVASESNKKGNRKSKKAPLYVVTKSSPLPPPVRPLPSLPQSAGTIPGGKPDQTVQTPIQPASAPLQYREEDRDSPILGMNSHKLTLQKSLVGSRSSSRYSNRSLGASDTLSDDQSSRTASPAISRTESRLGRSDQVHAIRMRDIVAKKKSKNRLVEIDVNAGPEATNSSKHSDLDHQQSNPPSHSGKVRSSRRNRVSEVPNFPLPQNPPVHAQRPPRFRRRGSTNSLPGSITTINGYEGSLSRSVSVTSGSIDSYPSLHGKMAYGSTDITKNLVQRNFRPGSPLPSSDEERHPSRTLISNKDGSVDKSGSDTRQGKRHSANGKSRQSTKQKAMLNHEQFSSHAEISQFTSMSSDSKVNYIHLMRHLESRIVTLERQNKMLQAALLAALDVGVSHDADSAHSRSVSPSLSSMKVPTISERSMPSPHNFGIDNTHQMQGKAAHRNHPTHNLFTHDTVSQGSRGSFETTSSNNSDSSTRLADGSRS